MSATVVITSYNRRNSLHLAYASARAQSWGDTQIIIADDNSSDPRVHQYLESLQERPNLVVFNSNVSEEDRPKTAFVTPDGLYQFKRLPFGLQASPPNFQRLMNQVLQGMLWTECLCYLDDILIHGRTFEEHNRRLDKCWPRFSTPASL